MYGLTPLRRGVVPRHVALNGERLTTDVTCTVVAKKLYILKYQPMTQNYFLNNFGVSGRIDQKLCVLLGTSVVHALNAKFLSGQVRLLTCDVISKGPSF